MAETRPTTIQEMRALAQRLRAFESGGKPHKFPVPGAATHVLLVDFRTFLNGGDEYDRVHVGLGGEFLPSEVHRRYWKEPLWPRGPRLDIGRAGLTGGAAPIAARPCAVMRGANAPLSLSRRRHTGTPPCAGGAVKPDCCRLAGWASEVA